MPQRRGSLSAPNARFSLAGYWATSRRPLQILFFLLPLVIAYELALVSVLHSQHDILTNEAHKSLLRFFSVFGISGLYLGGVVIVVVLLLWHMLAREPWRVDWRALGVMAIESILLAAPLLVLAQLIAKLGSAGHLSALGAMPLAGGPVQLAKLGVGAKIGVSIGAGLYEELVFRMLTIAVLHTLLVDIGKASHSVGAIVAVAVSASLFMLYHPAGPGGFAARQRLAFYLLAGLYFGAVYVTRGFGIVVGAHASYDIVTALFLVDDGPA